MQHAGLIQRMVFYTCELYAGQLKAGEDYTQLKPVYSVCLLDGLLFKNASNLHHRFRLSDPATGRVLADILELHVLELGRYNLREDQLATASVLERWLFWLFWLLNAQNYEPEELLRLFPEMEFQLASRALIEISEKTEDKAMYDAREKALRDQSTAINSARLEGEQAGELKGKLAGKLEGERIGRLMEKIGTLQDILNQTRIDDAQLRSMTIEQLTTLAAELQQLARGRSS